VALKRVAILAARLEFSELDYSESMDSMFLLQLRIVSDTGLVGGHPDVRSILDCSSIAINCLLSTFLFLSVRFLHFASNLLLFPSLGDYSRLELILARSKVPLR
jgi:hypothetical protein